METHTIVAMTVTAIFLGGLPAVGAAAGGPMAQPSSQVTTDTPANVSPGERLSGVLGAQEAELDGTLQERTFEQGLQRAGENQTQQAAAVARQTGYIEQRLRELDQRVQALEQQRSNETISEGAYQARMTRVEAERASVERIANTTNETATGLPAERLRDQGVNATRIMQLQQRASELTGPEVAAIARGIAGTPVGTPGSPGDRPQAGAPDNETMPGPADNTTPGGPAMNQSPQDPAANTTDGGSDDSTDQPGPPTDDAPSGGPANGGGPGE